MDTPHSSPLREPAAPISASASAQGSAPVHLPRPIPALTWQDAGGAWLLPAAAVLEVVRCDGSELVSPTPSDKTSNSGQPEAVPGLLGTFAWRGRPLPVVELGSARQALQDSDAAPTNPPGGRLRLLIAPTLDGGSGLDAIALAAIGNPAVVTVREGELAPAPGPTDAEPAGAEPLTLARLRLRGEPLSVPDLMALEGLLARYASELR